MTAAEPNGASRVERIRPVAMLIWFALFCAVVIYGFANWPNRLRYAMGVLCLMVFPGAMVFWCIVHPFINFWRRAGMLATYATCSMMLIAVGIAMYLARDRLLGKDLGNHWLLVIGGLVVYALAAWMEVQCRRRLATRTLVGVPELRNDASSERLINEGIYRLVRHPRYLSIIVGMVAFALIANYVGVYALTLAMIPGLYLIAELEERELVQRFGTAYQQYRDQVPRLFPTGESMRKFHRLFSQ